MLFRSNFSILVIFGGLQKLQVFYMPGVPSKGRYFNELMAKINYIYMLYGVNEGIFFGGVSKNN